MSWQLTVRFRVDFRVCDVDVRRLLCAARERANVFEKIVEARWAAAEDARRLLHPHNQVFYLIAEFVFQVIC